MTRISLRSLIVQTLNGKIGIRFFKMNWARNALCIIAVTLFLKDMPLFAMVWIVTATIISTGDGEQIMVISISLF